MSVQHFAISRRALLQTAAASATVAVALPTLALADDDLLAEIKKRGFMTAGVALDPPNSIQATDGSWYGFNIDLVEALGKSMGVKIKWISSTWATLVPGLLASKYDIIGCSLSATPERAQVIDFSKSYSASGQAFYYSKEGKFKFDSFDSLNKPDVTIAFIQGTVQGQIVQKILPNAQYRALTSASVGDLIDEVQSRRSDAFIFDSELRRPILEKYTWATCFPNTDGGFSSIPNVWGVPKGQPQLTAVLDAFVDQSLKNGEIDRLLQKNDTPQNAGL